MIQSKNSTKTLEESLKESWNDTKKLFGYPALDEPVFDSSIGTAAINMENHQISVNKNFVKKIVNYASKNGRTITNEDVIKGLLQHEVNHYMYCPYDLATAIQIENEISKVAKVNSHLIANYFMDVVINLDLISRKKRVEVLNIYQNIDKNHSVDQLICALYQNYSKIDLGAKITDNTLLIKLLDLKRIPYQKKDKWLNSAKKFALIINDLITEENKNLLNNFDDWDASNYSDSEIDKTISDIAQNMTPEDFFDSLNYMGVYGGTIPSMPISADSYYYEQQSKKYLLKILPKPSKSRSIDYSEHKKWEVSESSGSVDVFNSYGKYLPGLSNVWKESSNEESGIISSIPDLLLAIDTSGSMPNPIVELSNAVLGSFCAANIYLEKKSKIATYNFSSDVVTTDFCMDKTKIYSNLVYFQDGGTIFDIQELSRMLTKTSNKADIMILSDFFISNINELISYLESNSKVNRTNLLVIEPGSILNIKSNKIFEYRITDPSDIPKIMIGEARRYDK